MCILKMPGTLNSFYFIDLLTLIKISDHLFKLFCQNLFLFKFKYIINKLTYFFLNDTFFKMRIKYLKWI